MMGGNQKQQSNADGWKFRTQYLKKEIPMHHDWDTAPEAEWRHFTADHLETLAHNQAALAEKFDNFCVKHSEEHKQIEHRMTSVEHKSSWYALAISAIIGGIANIKSWLT
jgi:hypothetical protein